MRILLALAILACLASWNVALAADAPPEWPYPLDAPAVRGEHGMVVSDAPLAAEVGRGILRTGGNAVDAAVAAAFALAVVYPDAGNLGGGGFMVVHLADGTSAALDFRETAPARASRDMFLDAAGNLTGSSLTGALAAGVPGTVAGLWEAHQRFGSLAWGDLLAPAIALADTGYLISAAWHLTVAADSARLAVVPAMREHFLPDDSVPPEGARWREPELAATLRRIAAAGRAGFYEGPTADLIVAEMARDGGLISAEDLRGYRPRWREPIAFAYRGHRVISMPPPSSGGLALGLIARILEPWDLGALDYRSPAAIHLGVEAMRRAFAVRNLSLGDPDFVPVDCGELLSEARIAALRASISRERATPSSSLPLPPDPAAMERPHTTHLSAADGAGDAVALTTTLNDSFGSLVLVAGAGFVLNNEMDDFTAKPGAPNLYGLVQGEANAIAPGKRMLSSLAPTIVLDSAGRVRVVTGASGGPTIITSVFEVVSNVLDHGMTIAAAVNAPRFHHQHLPDEIRVEPGGMDPETMRALEAMGHAVRFGVPGVDARGVTPSIERRDGAWWGAADPRRGGAAAGY